MRTPGDSMKGRHGGEVELESYGRYEGFHGEGRDLPRIREFTTDIPCEEGALFGFAVHARRLKGARLLFRVERSREGGPREVVDEREIRVRANDEPIYVGEFVSPPVEGCLGEWRLTLWNGETLLIDKTFHVVPLAS